jgi:ATP-dependent DNA ligase
MLSSAKPPLHITPATQNRSIAQDWFQRFEGAGLDGVIAKDPSGIYQPDKRAMLKLKHERDCDCVVAGFRWHRKNRSLVGSLLLGLFDDHGSLHHVGVCSSFSDTARRKLVAILKPFRKNAAVNHPWKTSSTNAASAQPGRSSRWSQGKDLSWEPLRAELVVEVAYDHRQGDRFRHIAQFRRWRTDRRPETCTLDQLEAIVPQELKEIFG